MHFVHWRLPLFLFLDEVPHGRDINHFMITSFFSVLHPTSRRLDYVYVGGSPFPSVLLFGAIQIIFLYLLFLSPKFLLRCYFLFLPRFRLPAEISSNPFSHLALANASLAVWLVERPPKIRQLSLDLARSLPLTAYFFWLPMGFS